MADHDKYLTGAGTSRYLRPEERSWGGIVYRSGSPVLDSELILETDIVKTMQRVLGREQAPSGWLKGQERRDSYDDFLTPATGAGSFVTDAFYMSKRMAMVNGWPLVIEYTDTTADDLNLIQLEAAPVNGGAPPDVKRTDFVFLEVWQTIISDSANASGTITVASLPSALDTITIGVNTLTAVAGAPGVDQFTIGGSPAATAANIAAAINSSPPNSFTDVTASSDGVDTVTIRAVAAGTAGNAVALGSSVALVLIPSGATLVGGVDEAGKPSQDTLYRYGNVLSPVGVALPDDIADPAIGVETSKRIQIQYRVRATGASEAVNFKTESDGFSNTAVLAQGTTLAPVAGYPFVPADKTTIAGSSSAVAYDVEDAGLWVAGDGSPAAAAALGTVDGYVYAIPICFVFRRNDASGSGGWDPQTNTNGALSESHAGFVSPAVGAVPAGESDRPDALFFDAISGNDILDLRRHVALMGHDMASELDFQMKSLLDGTTRTWAIDAADKQTLGGGSGDVSTRFLVCNQIGRSGGDGGVPPLSGDTTRGVTIRSFDHIARRFSDSPVVERAVFAVLPTSTVGANPGLYNTQANGAYAGWAENDEINIDLTALNATTLGDFDPSGSTVPGGFIANYAPPGSAITDINVITHDDGHYTNPVPQVVQTKLVTGMGTPHAKIVLDRNDSVVNEGDPGVLDHRMVGDAGTDNGSIRRIFVEIEFTYPLGVGLTDTPDEQLTPESVYQPLGAMLENDTSQRPTDYETLTPVKFRDRRREVGIEYVANLPGSGIGSGTPITDNFVSQNTTDICTLRRLFGSGALLTGVTDSTGGGPRAVDTLLTTWGSSERKLVTTVALTGAGQTQVDVTYFGQDPVPNYGAPGGGYQVGVYYRSNAPQTVGVMAGALTTMEDPISIQPLLMDQGLWAGTVGPGSVDIPFPYDNPLDQIAMNDGGTTSFPGDWYFAATAQISIDDFNAETGLLKLHAVSPPDGTGDRSFNTLAKDAEFRAHYRVADVGSYRPHAFAQNLSNVSRHKVFTPFLAKATTDTVLYRKGEILLVVLSRFAELDDENTIRFTDTDNRSAAALYRTRSLLLTLS